MISVPAMSSGPLNRSFGPVWRFRIDVSDDVGQTGVAEVLADRGVR